MRGPRRWDSMDIHFISTLTPEDEDRYAPMVLAAVKALLDQMPISYAVRIVTANGTLAAATILTDPTSKVAQLGEYPVKDCTTKLIVFQSFMIDPAHQGKGLSHRLDDMAKELYPYANFMAKIATDNKDSLDSFVGRRGFEIVSEVDSKDVRDGTPYRAVFVFRASQSPLRPVTNGGAAQADVALPSK